MIKLRVHAGDHLFVDRLTYNFRQPERGEIVVFDTHGITSLPADQQDTFYIKRLVGLGGETLSLKQDYEVENVPRLGTVPVGHLVVDGQPLSASTPHFANLYAFADVRPGQKMLEYQPNHYYGHAMVEALAPGRKFSGGNQPLFCHGRQYLQQPRLALLGRFLRRPRHRQILLCLLAHLPDDSDGAINKASQPK